MAKNSKRTDCCHRGTAAPVGRVIEALGERQHDMSLVGWTL